VNITYQGYGLFILAVLAAACFFVGYPSQDPRSAIHISNDKQKVEQKATKILAQLGYDVEQLDIGLAFGHDQKLLDSLQQKLGRSQLIEKLKQKEYDNLLLFYREASISLRRKGDGKQNITLQYGNSKNQDDGEETVLTLRLDSSGRLMELNNSSAIIPSKSIQREVLYKALKDSADQRIAMEWMQAVPDSILSSSIELALWSSKKAKLAIDSSSIQANSTPNAAFWITQNGALRMGETYLEQTGWDAAALKVDSVFVDYLDQTKVIKIRYRSTEPSMGIVPFELELELLPTGSLMNVSSSYQLHEEASHDTGDLRGLIRVGLIFLFILAGLIVFFLRIRARAVDTKPALFIGILGGFTVFMAMLLGSIPQINSVTGLNNWTINLAILISIGLAGAASSVVFFVFAAIGDSITREYWSEKLRLNDYLRQGMIYNRPMGLMLIRSVCCAFILACIWTLLIWLMPKLVINIERVFLNGSALWPPLYLLFKNGGIALSIVLGVFLTLGGQTYALTKSKKAAYGLIIIGFIVAAPIIASYGPIWSEIVLFGVIGMALGFIYLQWEAVTLFMSFFLFSGLISTVSGWIVMDSPDGYIFITYTVFMGLFLLTGIWAASRGKKEQSLSSFVPNYVEELAHEERIKQELQIARDVQQSFLPIETPQFEHLEIAALCKPAYETGGDYYDIIQLDEDRIAVAIGDVSGKGIQAAFYMTFVKGILHSLCQEVSSPREFLKKSNKLFCDNAPRGVFISLIYGIIDLRQVEFHFARAGHNPVLHLDGSTHQITALQPRGIGIGLDDGHIFNRNIEEVTLSFDDQDLLVLYTDGIVEALNANNVFYGSRRLQNLLAKNGDKSADIILETLSSDISEYIGEAKQHDDMTILVIKTKGK